MHVILLIRHIEFIYDKRFCSIREDGNNNFFWHAFISGAEIEGKTKYNFSKLGKIWNNNNLKDLFTVGLF